MIERVHRDSSFADLYMLLERLEDLLVAGPGLPFVRRRLVDDKGCLAIIEQIKLSLPHEVRQAHRVNTEREALLEDARARAAQIVQAAERDADERIQEHYIARRAEAQGQELLQQAEHEATELRQAADEYAYSALAELEDRLQNLLATVQAGIEDLGAHRGAAVFAEDEQENA